MTAGSAQSNDEDFVIFSGVSKSYDGVTPVVQSLDLSIRRGEFLTMLGPSGSGKTTTLMMLAGFEEPTNGSIRIDGADLTKTPPHRRGIGMVFQNYALFPHMSVEDNVAFPLVARKLAKPEVKTKVMRALEMVKMESFASRRPAQLSGGQQQRIALARALVFEPGLVLMDEPLGALDKQLREHMQAEIKQLHRMLGVTIVYVTHDQDEALAMSDRVALFNNGVIEQIGAPFDIYRAPQTEFVARFVGENNLFAGEVASCVEAGPGYVATTIHPDGSRTAAYSDSFIRAGQRVQVVVRPECLTPFVDGGSCDNKVAAQVIETAYFGDHVRAKCRIMGMEATVKATNAAAFDQIRIGQTIELGWAFSDACVLTDEKRAS